MTEDQLISAQSEIFEPTWKRWLNILGPLLALLLVYGVFAAIAPPSFTTWRNLETIARQTTIVGMAALGMTLVIISGGIDLSVGSIVALSTAVIATLLQGAGAGPVAAAAGGVAAGRLWGLINGAPITSLRGVSFLAHPPLMLLLR